MAINDIVQYTSGFLPYILLITQVPILVWLDGTTIDISTILVTRYSTVIINGGLSPRHYTVVCDDHTYCCPKFTPV